jgi:hypothetical protein
MKKIKEFPGKSLFTALMFVFAILSVYPQTPDQYHDLVAALQRAAAEKDDTQRLALYDTLVRAFGIAEVPAALTTPQEPSKWVFDQRADP